jgi:hypothetical protein
MKLPTLTMGIRSDEVRHREVSTGVTASGCHWTKQIRCAAKVAVCAAACASGVGALACITCLGGSYDECKDCV